MLCRIREDDRGGKSEGRGKERRGGWEDEGRVEGKACGGAGAGERRVEGGGMAVVIVCHFRVDAFYSMGAAGVGRIWQGKAEPE